MSLFNVIDISEHNVRAGKIDFKKVKLSGVSGVMIRIGWAGYEGELHTDDSLHDSITQASAAGLDVGLYVYTYVRSTQAALKAAKETVEIANKYPGKITYPIAYDLEDALVYNVLTKSQMTDTIITFCDEVERQGYYAMLYTSTSFINSRLDKSRLAKYDLWVADYRGADKLNAQIGRSYGMWQYIGTGGRCDGVTGDCDRNYAYNDYASIITKNELNHTGPKYSVNCEDLLKQIKSLTSEKQLLQDSLEASEKALTKERDKISKILAIVQE